MYVGSRVARFLFQSSEGQNARRFFSSFWRVFVVGFGFICVVLRDNFGVFLDTLGSRLVTLGTILVILGTLGHLLEALGAQRRPAEKQTR